MLLFVSHSFEQYLQDIHEVLGRLESSDLKLNPRKCTFATNKTVFLRYEISWDGICPPSDRVDSIKSFPIPSTAKELRCTLPTWFRKYKPNYSITAFPHPASLLKIVNFVWTLINSSVLSFPKFDLPFLFAVDASSRRIGYMLHQLYDDDDTPIVIRFGSKGLNKWQKSYGPTKLELLGVITAVTYLASYIKGNHLIIDY